MTPDGYLTITTRQYGQTCVLHLVGDLDVTTTDQLRTAITSGLTHRPKRLVLDLTELEYTDCAGLSEMVRAHRALASGHGTLRVTGCRSAVRRLMRVTGTDTILCPDPSAPRRADGQGTAQAEAPGGAR